MVTPQNNHIWTGDPHFVWIGSTDKYFENSRSTSSQHLVLRGVVGSLWSRPTGCSRASLFMLPITHITVWEALIEWRCLDTPGIHLVDTGRYNNNNSQREYIAFPEIGQCIAICSSMTVYRPARLGRGSVGPWLYRSILRTAVGYSLLRTGQQCALCIPKHVDMSMFLNKTYVD